MIGLPDQISLRARHVCRIAARGGTARPRLFTFAESCTGGLLSAAITAIPGSSAFYPGGFVTYSNEAKINLLDVCPETLERHGAVSAECAAEMAKGAMWVMDADFGVSVTGIAGPSGGSKQKPVGTVWLALASDGRVTVKKIFHPRRSRSQIRLLSVFAALGLLIKGLHADERKL